MSDHSEAYVAFDSSKLRNAVAIADCGRAGEVRFLGEIENSAAATATLVRKLAGKYGRLTFCYEAGPTGYGLYRQIKRLGHECLVVAPSLIPKKAGNRVKTNRRDALHLVKLLRAGELTAVWVPDERHEAMRDLTRARGAAVEDLRRKRQHVSAFLLRHELRYAGKQSWSKAYLRWLSELKLAHVEQRIAFEEMLLAVRQAEERIVRLEGAIRAAVPDWSLAEVVTALMAMRGMDLVSATAFLGEIGDLSRFQTPRELMAYLGLVPSEDSTGDTIDFMLSPKRDLTAAKLFLRLALSGTGGIRPRVINVDGHPAYARAIAELKRSGDLSRRCRCRSSPYLNNVIEQDHRFIKKRIAASLWFRSAEGALRTIDGYEAMHLIRKGQIRWLPKGDVVGQRQFIHTLFGIAA